MSHLSRRSLVTSAAALPALAVPPVAGAAVTEPDPVFAAIKRYEDAHAGFFKAGESEPDHDGPKYEAWYDAGATACHKHADAARALFATVPATIAGIAAAVRFVKERETEAEKTGVGCLGIRRTDDADADFETSTLSFLTSLAKHKPSRRDQYRETARTAPQMTVSGPQISQDALPACTTDGAARS